MMVPAAYEINQRLVSLHDVTWQVRVWVVLSHCHIDRRPRVVGGLAVPVNTARGITAARTRRPDRRAGRRRPAAPTSLTHAIVPAPIHSVVVSDATDITVNLF